VNENVAPLPSLLFSAHILPPWVSTILFEINNPKPVQYKIATINMADEDWALEV
jgi:hypothetical protein